MSTSVRTVKKPGSKVAMLTAVGQLVEDGRAVQQRKSVVGEEEKGREVRQTGVVVVVVVLRLRLGALAMDGSAPAAGLRSSES